MTIQVIYARKPSNWGEIFAETRPHSSLPRPTVVVETLELSEAEYIDFCESPLKPRGWLAGKGGWDANGVIKALALKCPGRATLYVDPSGSDYGRYVGCWVV
jgi:hypothetical protein